MAADEAGSAGDQVSHSTPQAGFYGIGSALSIGPRLTGAFDFGSASLRGAVFATKQSRLRPAES
jgi:hypothetical protein